MAASFESYSDTELMHYVEEKHEYYLRDYIEHTPVQRAALAKACAVVTYAANYVCENPDLKPNAVYKDVCSAAARNDLRYVPKYFRKLKQRIDLIINDGLDVTQVIRLPRSNNANALAYDDPTIKACAIKMRSMPQNYTNEHIIRTIQRAYKVRGKRVPGRRWFGHNVFDRQQVKFLTDTQRYGVAAAEALRTLGIFLWRTPFLLGIVGRLTPPA